MATDDKSDLSGLELEKLYLQVLEPYAKDLGLLLHAWNGLHVDLASLFLAVCQDDPDHEDGRNILLAVWNAVPNDRWQRNMLRHAARSRFTRIEKRMEEMNLGVDVITKHEKKTLDEILWVLERADGLGRKRDDSAHLPLVFDLTIGEGEPFRFAPMAGLGNPIAEQLRSKDILAEYGLYRSKIEVLAQRTTDLWLYVLGTHRTLPKRPEWPASPQSSGHKDGQGPSRSARRKPRRPASRQ